MAEGSRSGEAPLQHARVRGLRQQHEHPIEGLRTPRDAMISVRSGLERHRMLVEAHIANESSINDLAHNNVAHSWGKGDLVEEGKSVGFKQVDTHICE